MVFEASWRGPIVVAWAAGGTVRLDLGLGFSRQELRPVVRRHACERRLLGPLAPQVGPVELLAVAAVELRPEQFGRHASAPVAAKVPASFVLPVPLRQVADEKPLRLAVAGDLENDRVAFDSAMVFVFDARDLVGVAHVRCYWYRRPMSKKAFDEEDEYIPIAQKGRRYANAEILAWVTARGLTPYRAQKLLSLRGEELQELYMSLDYQYALQHFLERRVSVRKYAEEIAGQQMQAMLPVAVANVADVLFGRRGDLKLRTAVSLDLMKMRGLKQAEKLEVTKKFEASPELLDALREAAQHLDEAEGAGRTDWSYAYTAGKTTEYLPGGVRPDEAERGASGEAESPVQQQQLLVRQIGDREDSLAPDSLRPGPAPGGEPVDRPSLGQKAGPHAPRPSQDEFMDDSPHASPGH